MDPELVEDVRTAAVVGNGGDRGRGRWRERERESGERKQIWKEREKRKIVARVFLEREERYIYIV